MANVNLSVLSKAWYDLLQHSCPADWACLLPALDFDNPDRQIPAHTLPVLSYLPRMAKLAPPVNQFFIDMLMRSQSELHFNQTYSSSDFGEAFLQQYGWIKFLGPDAYWHSDTLSSGFILLGDNITYPEHWHVAEELYIPLSGSAEWYHEQLGWRQLPPGTVIHHASNVKHGTRTIGEPLLAMYLWRGGDLLQKSNIND